MRGVTRARSLGFSLSFLPVRAGLIICTMKVSSAPSQPSALDTWLQDSDHADPDSILTAGSGTPAMPAAHGAPPGRDTAEGLLGLDVWDTDSTAGHQLITGAPAPEVATSGAAQSWAAHIFSPLV
jgi:hypothetical protein